MATALENMLIRAENLGFTDVLLPFVLIFTIVFAVLQKTKVLGQEDGKPKKNFNVVIALVMALAVIIPHVMGRYRPGQDVVVIINNALPSVSIILVAIICLLLLVGIWGSGVEFGGTSLSGWIVIFSILAVIAIFGGAAGWFGAMPRWLSFMNNPDTQALVVIILVFGLVIWFITKEPKKAEAGQKSWIKDIGEALKK
jgi:hypothetical protein